MNLIDVADKFLKEIAQYDKRTMAYVLEQLVDVWGLDVERKLVSQLYDYYTNTVVPHKAAVFFAGWVGLKDFESEPDDYAWFKRLLFHDLSKFSHAEAAYASYNFKNKEANTPRDKQAFELAWHHHKLNNSHHPEHWLGINRKGTLEHVFPMPQNDVVEMVADWIGAGQTYGNTLEDWLPANLKSFVFHTETAKVLTPILESVTSGLCISVDNLTGTPSVVCLKCKKI